MPSYTANNAQIHRSDNTRIAGDWSVAMMDGAYRDTDALTLGYRDNVFRGYEPAIVPYDGLYRHVTVTGMTGYGKTTLGVNALRQIAANGDGFCYISPSEEDIVNVLRSIPSSRFDDVIFIGDIDGESHGTNLLDVATDAEATKVAEQIVDTVEALGSAVGVRDKQILNNVIRTLAHDTTSYTLEDVYTVLSDNARYATFKKNHPSVDEYSADARTSAAKRLAQYVQSPQLRDALTTQNGNSISDAIASNKLLLINAEMGSNAPLRNAFASFAIRRVWASLLARHQNSSGSQDPFFLIMDDVDRMHEGLALDKMLSKARSLRCSIWTILQSPAQLPDEKEAALYGNAGNTLCFNAGEFKTANRLSTILGDEVSRTDLLNLDRYALAARMVFDSGPSAFSFQSFPQYPFERSAQDAFDAL